MSIAPSLHACLFAHTVSTPCSRLGCPGTARYETLCAGPAYCGTHWRRYLAARSVQFALSPVGDRVALHWWHVFINSADDGQITLLLYALRTLRIDVVALVDDIDRRSLSEQIAEVL